MARVAAKISLLTELSERGSATRSGFYGSAAFGLSDDVNSGGVLWFIEPRSYRNAVTAFSPASVRQRLRWVNGQKENNSEGVVATERQLGCEPLTVPPLGIDEIEFEFGLSNHWYNSRSQP